MKEVINVRNKILELLKERGISKCQMAKDLNVTPQHLNMIIKGTSNGSAKFWINFMKAYDLTFNEIEQYKQKG